MNKKTLTILKTGHFETFEEDRGQVVSLGDVLRTTALLRMIGEFERVTWITSNKAKDLLPQTPELQILTFEDGIDPNLYSSENGVFLNLERHHACVPFFLKHEKNILGYVPTGQGWRLRNHLGQIFSLPEWNEKSRNENRLTANSRLFNLLGFSSSDTSPLFSKPQVSLRADVGINWKPGPKWGSKSIGHRHWEQLAKDLSPEYKVSWQEGFDSILEYAAWIASNRLLVTIDSLGLHLAIAMQIPVVALFGPTNPLFIDKHEKASFISLIEPKVGPTCSPCYLESCNQPIHCSEYFPFKKIKSEIDRILLPGI